MTVVGKRSIRGKFESKWRLVSFLRMYFYLFNFYHEYILNNPYILRII